MSGLHSGNLMQQFYWRLNEVIRIGGGKGGGLVCAYGTPFLACQATFEGTISTALAVLPSMHISRSLPTKISATKCFYFKFLSC